MIERKSILDNYTKEEIKEAISKSKNYLEVVIYLGLSKKQKYLTRILKRYVEKNNIDISHFTKKVLSDEEIFCKNSKVSQHALRLRYRENNYTKYKCALCDLDEWNGMPIVLNLDHIDGDNHNNELSNLRWLCPNCDSQLPTFCNNKKEEEKVKHICKKCGKELSGKRKTGLCIECIFEDKEEINKEEKYSKKLKKCPTCEKLIRKTSIMCIDCRNKEKKQNSAMGNVSREELKFLIRNKSFVEIGKIYGINDNSVKKYCKKHNLPSKKEDINKYTDEEWDKI